MEVNDASADTLRHPHGVPGWLWNLSEPFKLQNVRLFPARFLNCVVEAAFVCSVFIAYLALGSIAFALGQGREADFTLPGFAAK